MKTPFITGHFIYPDDRYSYALHQLPGCGDLHEFHARSAKI